MKLLNIKRNQLLSLGIALIFALTMYPTKAHAQSGDKLEVNVPFEFHAGNSKLPAGKYRIQALDDSDLLVMEISSADGSTAALFSVQPEESNSLPATSELIFNKYGNRYFLAKVVDEGNPRSNKVVESRYEKLRAADVQQHVPANHRG